MVYKTQIKGYVIIGIVSGGTFGLVMGILRQNLIAGFSGGIIFGLLYSLYIAFASKRQAKKFDTKREEIKRSKKLYSDGPATFANNGGWLFLTEDALEFYPQKLTATKQPLCISLTEIQTASIEKGKLIVQTTTASYPFVVVQPIQMEM